jgi:hypothetical protein
MYSKLPNSVEAPYCYGTVRTDLCILTGSESWVVYSTFTGKGASKDYENEDFDDCDIAITRRFPGLLKNLHMYWSS